MRNKLTLLAKTFLAFSIFTTGCLTLRAGMPILDKFRIQSIKTLNLERQSRGIHETEYLQAFMKLSEGATVNEIEAKGVKILNQIDDILIVSIPLDNIEELLALPYVQGIQLARKLKPVMDIARTIGKVDSVQQGIGLTVDHGFDGSGTLVSLFDTGLDPNNPNFSGRVGIVYDYSDVEYDSETGEITSEPATYEGSQVGSFTTDTSSETHGTHVLGIMTGDAQVIDTCYLYAGKNSSGNFLAPTPVYNGSNPYYGVAKGADIAVACSNQLINAYIIDGVERLIQYGEQQNLPVTINLSLGDNLGPHDGTDYAASALSKLGERANIFIAAGNEGADNIAITKTFDSDSELKTFIVQQKTSNNKYVRTTYYTTSDSPLYAEIWGKNSDILDANVVIASNAGNIQNSFPITSKEQSINLANLYPNDFTAGHISFYYELDSVSGRYNAAVYSDDLNQKSSSLAYIGLSVNGKTGQRADFFTQDMGSTVVEFSSRSRSGWTQPDGQMSISNMACGDNVIVIGAMNPRYMVPVLQGKGQYYYDIAANYTVDSIFDFSSFGTLINGKSLPDYCAPGLMISSLNHYYTTKQSSSTRQGYSGVLHQSGNTYYWGYMAGTSMATPFSAGVGALWQQCYMEKNGGKTLNSSGIIDIATKNTIQNSYFQKSKFPQQWGAGIVDAFSGIKYILTGVSGIGKIHLDEPERDHAFMMTLRGRDMNLFVADASAMDVDVISLTGNRLLSRSVDNNDYTLSLDNLEKGIYLIKVVTPEGGNYTRKITLN